MFKIVIALALCIAATSALPKKHLKQYAYMMPRPVGPDGRIVGGTDAVEGQFPYQVYMEISGNFQCGGSIIDETWILTAAHCVRGVSAPSVTITAGDLVLSDTTGQEQVMQAAELIDNEDFSFFTALNDIALIRLESPINLEGNVAAIPLATAGPSEGEEVIISGWGKTADDSDIADTLQFTTLTVADSSVCTAVYGNNIDAASQICYTTLDGHSACNGDSGGPMVPNDESVVYGVTSFGSSAGCESGAPGVYTNVAAFLDWIDAQMSS